MYRILSLITLMSVMASSYAVEETAVETPDALVSIWWVAAFGVLFIGLCAWYVRITMRNERAAQSDSRNGKSLSTK